MIRKILFCGLLAGILALSACAAQATVSPATPTDAPVASEIPAPEPTRVPGEPAASPAAEAARAQLARLTGAPYDAVAIRSLESVEWPDACLGIVGLDMVCAEVITPGYIVSLSYDGREYIYHTDQSGEQIKLASAPPPQISEAAIQWSGDLPAGCGHARLSAYGILLEPCGQAEEAVTYPYANPHRIDELAELSARFGSFQSETQAGEVRFEGAGELTADAVLQRAIAEWARLAVLEVIDPLAASGMEMALSWELQGGIMGMCETVRVSRSGLVQLESCRQTLPPERAYSWLNAVQLRSLYYWLDTYRAGEVQLGESMAADALLTQISFQGLGTQAPEDSLWTGLDELAAGLQRRVFLQPDEDQPAEAHQALAGYLESLKAGDYAAALSVYGGDYETLRAWNPDLPQEDLERLFEAGCEYNGLICNLTLLHVVEVVQTGPGVLEFVVELAAPDGELFQRGPCCGASPEDDPPQAQFIFRVEATEMGYQVLDLPVYVP